MGTVKKDSCASCGIQELIRKKPQSVDIHASSEFNWTICSLENASFFISTTPVAMGENYYFWNGAWYYLIKSLINEETKTFSLCPDCNSAMKKAVIPKFSLKNNMDFGINNLEPLSFIESLMISKTITHSNLIKLSWGPNSSTAIRGHCISVQHNGLSNTLETLPCARLDDVLQISYIGPKDKSDLMKQRFPGFEQLKVSIRKIMFWLTWLKATNPLYSNIIINTNITQARIMENIMILFQHEGETDPNPHESIPGDEDVFQSIYVDTESTQTADESTTGTVERETACAVH